MSSFHNVQQLCPVRERFASHPEPDGNLLRELRRQFPLLLVFKSKTNNWVIYGHKQAIDPLPADKARLNALEARLPIGWRKLVNKLSRLAPPAE